MSPTLKHRHGSFFFSHDGHTAFNNGEKPLDFFENKMGILPCSKHHVEYWDSIKKKYVVKLVPFYKNKNSFKFIEDKGLRRLSKILQENS
jgi:hypothetical protein